MLKLNTDRRDSRHISEVSRELFEKAEVLEQLMEKKQEFIDYKMNFESIEWILGIRISYEFLSSLATLIFGVLLAVYELVQTKLSE
jgi:hypothetical protein